MTEYKINREIPFKRVMVVTEEGNSLGVMHINEAIAKATESSLDLVCIAPNAATPVCKIIDYGRFKYNLSKKEKAAKKNQHNTEISEIQLTYTIQEHDLMVKANTAKRLIQDKGNDVRVVLRLRGREINMKDVATEKLQHFVELCKPFSKVKKEIMLDGRDIKVVLEGLK